MERIKSIEKGWGESSAFYSTVQTVSDSYKVDKIVEESKNVGIGEYGEINHLVYRGYKNDKLVFEIGASIDIMVAYYTE